MIHACIPFGATVIFRTTPAEHYQTGRVFGVCKKGEREFYDIEDSNGGRHFGLEDVKEETNAASD